MAHVDGDLFAAGLSAGKPGVAAAGQVEMTAGIQGGFGMRQTVTVLMSVQVRSPASASPSRDGTSGNSLCRYLTLTAPRPL